MIHLKKLEGIDFNKFKSWIKTKDELFQFAGPIFIYPLTDVQLNQYINDPRRISYKVLISDTNEIIGHCELNYENATPRLSRILIGEKEFRNKGYGKHIVNSMLSKLFIEGKFENADLNVFDWNTSAIRCYTRVGFKINKAVISEQINNGKIWKALNMTISKKDWLKALANTKNNI